LQEFSENVVQIGKVMSYKIGLYKVELENGVFEEFSLRIAI